MLDQPKFYCRGVSAALVTIDAEFEGDTHFG